MGNIAHISSPKKLTFSSVTEQLHEINQRRFGGFFTIEILHFNDQQVGWGITHENSGWVWELSSTYRKISGKHPWRPWPWITWAWNVFQHELALSWRGRLSDEGVEGTWAPDLEWCRTFPAYQNAMYSHIHTLDHIPEGMVLLIEGEQNAIPLALRPYAGVDE